MGGPAVAKPPGSRFEHDAILICLAIVWAAILFGFGREIVQHVAKGEPPYPPIVHVHGVVFVGWLALLTTQVLLIGRRRVDLHRRLGIAGVVLAGVMMILGPATAFYMQRYHFGTPKSDPAFVAIQLTDMLAFGGLVVAGWGLRNTRPAHKRLMLLATLYISDAGFARIFGDPMHALLGDGFVPFLFEAYTANSLLMLGIGAFDLITRKRLYGAYVAGMAWILANEVTASWLYHAPWWNPIALRLIGH